MPSRKRPNALDIFNIRASWPSQQSSTMDEYIRKAQIQAEYGLLYGYATKASSMNEAATYPTTRLVIVIMLGVTTNGSFRIICTTTAAAGLCRK
jgi:hypothetical protein